MPPSEDLLNELTSINSIYPPNTLNPPPSPEDKTYTLTLPQQQISLHLFIPPTYPSHHPPTIDRIASLGPDIPRSAGPAILSLVREVLARVFVPGQVCLYDFVEELLAGEGWGGVVSAGGDGSGGEEEGGGPGAAADFAAEGGGEREVASSIASRPQMSPQSIAWKVSAPLILKKSRFLAHATPISDPAYAAECLAALVAGDKAVARATHNITAFRVRCAAGDGTMTEFEEGEDDGEEGAGKVLLGLMQEMGVWGTLVVVSRWYGGVKLGGARFRCIRSVGGRVLVGKEGKDGMKGG